MKQKNMGCFGCLGALLALSIIVLAVIYLFQNIVGFLGIGLSVFGVYWWIKSSKPIKQSRFSLISIPLGLIVAIIWFTNFHNTSAFQDVEEETKLASSEVKEESEKQPINSDTEKEVKNPSSPKEASTAKTNNSPAAQTNEQKEETQTGPADVNLIPAVVTYVTDGDTIKATVNGKEETIRMILVDTPETKHPNKPVQPFGPEASEFTKKMLSGKKIGLEKDVSERDRYGRLLAYIWVDGKLFNQMLIEKGLARVAVYQPDIKYLDEFRNIQSKAQKAGIGIWSIENYAQEDGYKDQSNTSTASKPSSTAKTTQKTAPKTAPAPAAKAECNIKGNQSGIYHMPGGQYYEITKAEEWFCSPAEAEAAGYRASKR